MPDEYEAALAQEYRASQVRIGLALTKDILTIWRYFDPQSIDQSWGQMLRAILVMTSESRVKSAAQSEAYFRALSPYPEVRAAFAARRLPSHIQTAAEKADWEARAATSLDITGNYMTKSAIGRGVDAAQAVDEAFVRVSGVSQRHALDGGRAKMFELGDQAGVMKWRRVGGPNPCAFCRMLIGRGAVYRRATSTFRTHDHCQCLATPDLAGQFAPRRYGITRRPGESQRAYIERYLNTAPQTDLIIQGPSEWAVRSGAPLPWTHFESVAQDVREKVTRVMDTWERENIVNDQFETLFVVNPRNGEIVMEVAGQEGSVSISGEQMMRLQNMFVTHNHPGIQGMPGGTQLVANFVSPQDMMTAQQFGLGAMRAARHGDGIAQVEIAEKWRGVDSSAFRAKIAEVYHETYGRCRSLYPDDIRFERVFSDWLARAFQDEGLIRATGLLPDAELLRGIPNAPPLE